MRLSEERGIARPLQEETLIDTINMEFQKEIISANLYSKLRQTFCSTLLDLTNKNKSNTSRGGMEQHLFAKLKELLCDMTNLATPNADLLFQTRCDASDYGVGSCPTRL
ncbi:hypothetical protein NPIL_312281 [Nephila pilipes]|uniref:Reverse transcriptase/retrotransposon-derived protein RNase H-like domain-containing protein n=1 Tax=Nephila pilipes TaxID=299642 RepID=A0A8X6NQK7_NEPPI|nr:hypothetical protein NPIL_312281 [Nephila pilipes]